MIVDSTLVMGTDEWLDALFPDSPITNHYMWICDIVKTVLNGTFPDIIFFKV